MCPSEFTHVWFHLAQEVVDHDQNLHYVKQTLEVLTGHVESLQQNIPNSDTRRLLTTDSLINAFTSQGVLQQVADILLQEATESKRDSDTSQKRTSEDSAVEDTKKARTDN